MNYYELLQQETDEYRQAQPLVADLVSAFSAIKKSGISHTNKNPQLGYAKWLSCRLLGLKPRGSEVVKGAPLVDSAGRFYSVKTKIEKEGSKARGVSVTKKGQLDFLVVVRLNWDNTFRSLWLVGVPPDLKEGKTFKLSFKDTHLVEKEVLPDQASGIEEADRVMRAYSSAAWKLVENEVTRLDDKVPADLGEFYAAQFFGLTLEDKINRPDYDATDVEGRRYQIKTRQETPLGDGSFQDCFGTYTSFNFANDKMIHEKTFDTLIGCFLDRQYEPIAFILAPYEVVRARILGSSGDQPRAGNIRYRWTYSKLNSRQDYTDAKVFITRTHRKRYEPLRHLPNVDLTLF